MGRFAAIVLIFAFIFAMMVPSDFSVSTGEEDSSISRAPVETVQSDDVDEAPVEQPALEVSDVGISIQRGEDGQFHLNAEVNGQEMPFLVDTGADHVALTVESARRAGIDVDPESFEPVGMGAGGVVEGQRIRLESMSVAGHDIGAIDALVLNGLTKNLLGQSVLREVASLELSGDTMTIN